MQVNLKPPFKNVIDQVNARAVEATEAMSAWRGCVEAIVVAVLSKALTVTPEPRKPLSL